VDRERWGRERATLQRAGPTASVIGFPGTVLEDGNGVRYVVEATGEMFAALPNAKPGLKLLRAKTAAEGNSRWGPAIHGTFSIRVPRLDASPSRSIATGRRPNEWTNETPTCPWSRQVQIKPARMRSLAAPSAEDLPPILASIRMSLAASETSRRDLVQSRAGDPNSEPTSNRRKSTG